LECPKLSAKTVAQGSHPRGTQLAAPVSEVEVPDSSQAEVADELVALVKEDDGGSRRTGSSTKVVNICNNNCELVALFDTGSPVSFVNYDVFLKLIQPYDKELRQSNRKFVNIKGDPFNIFGVVIVDVTLEGFETAFQVELFILKEFRISYDIIFGRDFIRKQNLAISCVSKGLHTDHLEGDVNLFEVLPLYAEDNSARVEKILKDIVIDYESSVRDYLTNLINEIEETRYDIINDDYSVKVYLKDESIFAYAPRRFAHAERLQLREITDNLTERGIIKNSISPYCLRVVLVKKKNGQSRLCIDLRPLNARILKQKYPFPIIEDCLSRLINKSVFTLLDLKDGFHQIKVHDDSTKYFSFATPDGQFEYTRLPFGYSEAPAEFQKRIIQILNPLIRRDKIIVYINDILIPSESVDENLETLKETLILLKQYGFEVNYNKCLFLKNKIEFLGYVITHNEATLSPRHTDAISKFKQPTNVHEVQRFLGLTGYFRRFIKDFSLKARPLQNLLREDTKFVFDEACIKSFKLLKEELIAYPVLALYNPAAETELHTDACSQGLGGVLLQKQSIGKWSALL